MLGDGGARIVTPEFTADSAHRLESVDMTTHESLEALAVRELHKQFAAVTFDQAEGIELARVTRVEKGTEMPPSRFRSVPLAPAPCAHRHAWSQAQFELRVSNSSGYSDHR